MFYESIIYCLLNFIISSRKAWCIFYVCAVLCLVAQSCPTLCDSVDCSSPGCSVHGDSPGKNTGMRCHALLQGIFPIQGLNPGLLPCRWILYLVWATREAHFMSRYLIVFLLLLQIIFKIYDFCLVMFEKVIDIFVFLKNKTNKLHSLPPHPWARVPGP